MRRAFALDVLACPACGGRLRLVALIFDPATLRAVLDSSAVPSATRAPPTDGTAATATVISGTPA